MFAASTGSAHVFSCSAGGAWIDFSGDPVAASNELVAIQEGASIAVRDTVDADTNL